METFSSSLMCAHIFLVCIMIHMHVFYLWLICLRNSNNMSSWQRNSPEEEGRQSFPESSFQNPLPTAPGLMASHGREGRTKRILELLFSEAEHGVCQPMDPFP